MDRTANDVLDLPAEEALSWAIGETLVPSQCNWHGLAEVAAMRATAKERTDSARVAWAKVSLVAYTFLIRHTREVTGGSYELSALLLKVNMISAGITDPTWTPAGVMGWFRRSISMSLQEAERRAAETTLPAHALALLRRLRTKIAVLKQLSECHGQKLDPDLVGWVELLGRLP